MRCVRAPPPSLKLSAIALQAKLHLSQAGEDQPHPMPLGNWSWSREPPGSLSLSLSQRLCCSAGRATGLAGTKQCSMWSWSVIGT